MLHSPEHSSNGHSRSNGAPANGAGSLWDGALYGDGPARRSSQLHDLLGTLWGGKWIILGALIVCLAGAAIYTYTIPTKYRTSTLLLVDRSSNNPLSQMGGSSSYAAYGGQSRSLQNELLVLQQSRTIPNRVADRLAEMGDHPQTGRPLEILRGPEGRQRTKNQVAGRIQGMTRAGMMSEQSDAVRISATGLDSREVGLIANLFAEEYIKRTKEKSRESLRASETFLEEQAEKLKQEVAAAESRIETYMREQGAVALDQETNRVVSQLSDLQAQRDELQIELDMTRSALETQKENLDEIEPKLSERLSSSIQEKLSRIQEQKAQLEATIEQFEATNSNPTTQLQRELQEKKERAQNLERRADSLAQEYVRQSLAAGGVASGSGGEGGPTGVAYVAHQRREIAQKQVEVDGLEARLGALNKRIDELQTSMKNLPTQSIEMAQLQRERRSSERVYSYVREKLQETRMSLESEVGYAEVIRAAGPGYPLSPGWKKNLLLGMMLGLVAGGGIVVLRDQLDTSIREPDDLHDHGHRLAGVVPSMDELIEKDFGGEKTIEIDGQQIQTSLVMLTSPMSAVAESYRRIRTNLQFSRPDRELRTLAVSSADKGEGKTTTSANLAFALASAGKRTLLVDADLRRPRLHELLDLPREPGLSQLLYDDSRSLDRFSTTLNDLHVVPGGEDVPNPAELMGSQRMGELVEELQQQFDYVIFDTPPVLLFSDALGLASQCDGTLLVASADSTDGRAFDHAVELLHDVEADVLGAILNRYDASSFLQGYGQYNYGYAHSYRRLEEHYAEPASKSGIRGWFTG
jgi:capsular exopolysaccharide synthesis family protein